MPWPPSLQSDRPSPRVHAVAPPRPYRFPAPHLDPRLAPPFRLGRPPTPCPPPTSCSSVARGRAPRPLPPLAMTRAGRQEAARERSSAQECCSSDFENPHNIISDLDDTIPLKRTMQVRAYGEASWRASLLPPTSLIAANKRDYLNVPDTCLYKRHLSSSSSTFLLRKDIITGLHLAMITGPWGLPPAEPAQGCVRDMAHIGDGSLEGYHLWFGPSLVVAQV